MTIKTMSKAPPALLLLSLSLATASLALPAEANVVDDAKKLCAIHRAASKILFKKRTAPFPYGKQRAYVIERVRKEIKSKRIRTFFEETLERSYSVREAAWQTLMRALEVDPCPAFAPPLTGPLQEKHYLRHLCQIHQEVMRMGLLRLSRHPTSGTTA
jgi:hypothetical protein